MLLRRPHPARRGLMAVRLGAGLVLVALALFAWSSTREPAPPDDLAALRVPVAGLH